MGVGVGERNGDGSRGGDGWGGEEEQAAASSLGN